MPPFSHPENDSKAVEYIHVSSNYDAQKQGNMLADWMLNTSWPVPGWLEKDCTNVKFINYDAYLRFNLRTRYLSLESNFRTVLKNCFHESDFDKVTAERIGYLLQTARIALENHVVNLLTISNSLDIIEQYMIWLYPREMVLKRVEMLASKLIRSRPTYSSLLFNALKGCDGNPNTASLRAIYDEITGEINRETTNVHINYGLQISRLELLRTLSLITLIATVLISPLLLNHTNKTIEDYAKVLLMQYPIHAQELFRGWLMITMLTTFGALGGYISGMLKIKSTSTNLQRYKESLLIFQLKPLLGGITAAIISILLSWNLLPGIKIESLGSFIIIAFITGFSERYFLQLMNIDDHKDEKKVAEKAAEVHSTSIDVQSTFYKDVNGQEHS